MEDYNILEGGLKFEKASNVLILLHGRGSNSEDIMAFGRRLTIQRFTLLAPQAPDNSWYPYSFLEAPEKNKASLNRDLDFLADLVLKLEMRGFKKHQLFFLGFSQGACLTLEFTTRNAARYGGIIALTGGLIGDKIYEKNYSGNFESTPVFIGTSDPDMHVPVERVEKSAAFMTMLGAVVTTKIYKNMGHTINQDEILHCNHILSSL